MKSKGQKPSPEDSPNMKTIAQICMRNALYHYNSVDARTLLVLQNLDIFEGEARPFGDELEIPVLENPEHPRRIKLPLGPLILFITKNQEQKRIVVDIPVLLLSEIKDVRNALLKYLEQIVHSNSLLITPKTESTLLKHREALSSDDPTEWRLAAIAIYDALNEDILFALQGIRQSLNCDPVIQDSLNSYVSKVLRPTITSLDSISLGFNNPEAEHEQFDILIDDIIIKAESLFQVCSDYYKKMGYLPLAPRYSMAEAVKRWIDTHSETDAWTEVWDWAHRAFGPIPSYHACCVFIIHPELIPQGKLPDLWDEIIGIVCNQKNDGDNDDGYELWEMRFDLLKHYTHHIESHLPDQKSASIACFAWWFSEQFMTILPDNPEAAKFYRENWIQPAAELSTYIWITASPHIQRSFLRYITYEVRSPWALGLLSIMGDKFEHLAINEQSDKVKIKFHDSLIFNAISYLPFLGENPTDPTYSLECPLAETVLKWASFQEEDQRKDLAHLVATSRVLGTIDGLCNAMRKLGESSLGDQIVVSTALKAKAYTDPTIADGVWDIISDQNWRLTVLCNLNLQMLCMLIETFCVLMVYNRDKWSSFLPHYIAELCEITEDEERLHSLFLYVLLTCLASDTVSAVRRLLRGEHKAKFIEFTKDFRDRVEAMQSKYPPWVAGKLRSLIANMHVV